MIELPLEKGEINIVDCGYIKLAVVSLRQLERQCNRDKERSAEHLKTVEDHYTKQIELLQQKLLALEKERNLMMVSIRHTDMERVC